MPATRPWTPHAPVWEWDGITREIKDLAGECYGELTLAIERDARQYIEVAKMRAYCAIIEILHENNIFTTEHLHKCDVIRQVDRAESFRRNDAIGRYVMEGTWTKDLRGLEHKEKREKMIEAAMETR